MAASGFLRSHWCLCTPYKTIFALSLLQLLVLIPSFIFRIRWSASTCSKSLPLYFLVLALISSIGCVSTLTALYLSTRESLPSYLSCCPFPLLNVAATVCGVSLVGTAVTLILSFVTGRNCRVDTPVMFANARWVWIGGIVAFCLLVPVLLFYFFRRKENQDFTELDIMSTDSFYSSAGSLMRKKGKGKNGEIMEAGCVNGTVQEYMQSLVHPQHPSPSGPLHSTSTQYLNTSSDSSNFPQKQIGNTGVFLCTADAGEEWITFGIHNTLSCSVMCSIQFLNDCSNLCVYVLVGCKREEGTIELVIPENTKVYVFQLGAQQVDRPWQWDTLVKCRTFTQFEPERQAMLHHTNIIRRLGENGYSILHQSPTEFCARCITNKAMFVDTEFSPNMSALISEKAFAEYEADKTIPPWALCVVWRRPQDISRTTLLPSSFSPNTNPDAKPVCGSYCGPIQAGALGNTILLSCFGIILQQPAAIVNKILDSYTQQQLEAGLVRFQVCKDGWWKEVWTDTCIPCSLDGVPCFGASVNPLEMLPSFLEKCFGKLTRHYSSLKNYQVVSASTDLTGFPCITIPLSNLRGSHKGRHLSPNRMAAYECNVQPLSADPNSTTTLTLQHINDADMLWEALATWLHKRYIVTAVPPSDTMLRKANKRQQVDSGRMTANGIECTQAYSIVKIETRNGNERWLYIYNPLHDQPKNSENSASSCPHWATSVNVMSINNKAVPNSDVVSSKQQYKWISWTDFQACFMDVVVCLYDSTSCNDVRMQGAIVQQSTPQLNQTFFSLDNTQEHYDLFGTYQGLQQQGSCNTIECPVLFKSRPGLPFFVLELHVKHSTTVTITAHQRGNKDHNKIGIYVLKPSPQTPDDDVNEDGELDELDPKKTTEEGIQYELYFWSRFSADKQVSVQVEFEGIPNSNALPYIVLPVVCADEQAKKGSATNNENEVVLHRPVEPPMKSAKEPKSKESEDPTATVKVIPVTISIQSGRHLDVSIKRLIPDLLVKCWLLSVLQQQTESAAQHHRYNVYDGTTVESHYHSSGGGIGLGIEILHFTGAANSVSFAALNRTNKVIKISIDFSRSHGYLLDTNADKTLPKSILRNFNYDIDDTDNDLFTNDDMVFHIQLNPQRLTYITNLNLVPNASSTKIPQWEYTVHINHCYERKASTRTPSSSSCENKLHILVDPVYLRPLVSPLQVNGKRIPAAPPEMGMPPPPGGLGYPLAPSPGHLPFMHHQPASPAFLSTPTVNRPLLAPK